MLCRISHMAATSCMTKPCLRATAEGRAKAYAIAAGLGAFVAASVISPARWALERFVLPAPGEGPSAEFRRSGVFSTCASWARLRMPGQSARKSRVADRGSLSTSKMLGQAAACLAALDKSNSSGGFWTPATCFGDHLLAALKAHAGITFQVLDV